MQNQMLRRKHEPIHKRKSQPDGEPSPSKRLGTSSAEVYRHFTMFHNVSKFSDLFALTQLEPCSLRFEATSFGNLFGSPRAWIHEDIFWLENIAHQKVPVYEVRARTFLRHHICYKWPNLGSPWFRPLVAWTASAFLSWKFGYYHLLPFHESEYNVNM